MTIDFSQSSIHLRSSMLTEFTVKDYGSFASHQILNALFITKEKLFHGFRSVEIDCTLDVSSIVFIIESAINY